MSTEGTTRVLVDGSLGQQPRKQILGLTWPNEWLKWMGLRLTWTGLRLPGLGGVAAGVCVEEKRRERRRFFFSWKKSRQETRQSARQGLFLPAKTEQGNAWRRTDQISQALSCPSRQEARKLTRQGLVFAAKTD